MVFARTGYPLNVMMLVWVAKQLDDSKNEMTMQDLGIHNLSTVHLLFRLPGGSTNLKVSLADSCGQEISLFVSVSDTIA